MKLHPFCVIYFCGIEKEIMINDWWRGGRKRRRQKERVFQVLGSVDAKNRIND